MWKNGRIDRDVIWVGGSDEPKERCITWCPDPKGKGQIYFWGMVLRNLTYGRYEASSHWRCHGGARVGTCPPYLNQGGSLDLHKCEEFFWRSRGGGSRLRMSLKVHRISSMNTSRKCVCPLQIVYAYLAKSPDHRWSSAPGLRWDFRPPHLMCPPYLQTLATPLPPPN